MVAQSTGYRTFVGKNGTPWFIYNFLIPFTDAEEKQGQCVGSNVASYWTNKFIPVNPGVKCELLFEPNASGRAVLTKIIELSKGGENYD